MTHLNGSTYYAVVDARHLSREEETFIAACEEEGKEFSIGRARVWFVSRYLAVFPFLWYAKKEKIGSLCMKQIKRSNANTDRAANSGANNAC